MYQTVRTADIYNGKIVDTRAKSILLTHLYMDSILILIVLELAAKTHTYFAKIIVSQHHKSIISKNAN